MKEQETFILAAEGLKDIVDKIEDDQWEMEMPEGFSATTSGTEILTLRDVINYHAYDDAWVPDMLAGKTMVEVGADKFDGDLLGKNPKDNFAKYVDKAVKAARELDDSDRIVHFSYGDYPAREALKHITTFRGLRVYTLSEVLGQDTDLPDELVQGLWEMIHPHAEEWREMGIFGPEVEVPDDAPLQDRLLGLVGFQP